MLPITLPAALQARNVTACYDVELFFLKVGESCITFRDDKETVSVSSFMRTVNIGSLAKRINDKGEGVVGKAGYKARLFRFHQEEGQFKRYQEYNFVNNKVYVRETRYKGLSDVIIKDERKEYEANDYLDPYAAALYLFENIEKNQNGTIKLFYDDRFYNIPYWRLKKEETIIDGVRYETYKVLIKPYIQGKGLLKPKGDWYLWVDRQSKMPIKMRVGFIIGGVDVLIKSLR